MVESSFNSGFKDKEDKVLTPIISYSVRGPDRQTQCRAECVSGQTGSGLPEGLLAAAGLGASDLEEGCVHLVFHRQASFLSMWLNPHL